MMNFEGRYYLKNGTLVGVHKNPAALLGNREERWIGHDIVESKRGNLKICWNENGECVWVMGVVDDVKKYDLMERVSGKDTGEGTGEVKGCKECEG
jgi:hypothetical protein